MLDACVEEFQPVNEFEQRLVEEIASAKWRLRRAWTVETALWDREMDEQHEEFSRSYRMSDEGTRQALAFKALAEKGKALSLIGRYESRLKRDIETPSKPSKNAGRIASAKLQIEPHRSGTGHANQKWQKEKLPNELPEPHTTPNPSQRPSRANSAHPRMCQTNSRASPRRTSPSCTDAKLHTRGSRKRYTSIIGKHAQPKYLRGADRGVPCYGSAQFYARYQTCVAEECQGCHRRSSMASGLDLTTFEAFQKGAKWIRVWGKAGRKSRDSLCNGRHAAANAAGPAGAEDGRS